MILILDADSLLYKAGFSVEKTIRHVTANTIEGTETFTSAADMREWLKDKDLTRASVTIKEEKIIEPVENAIHLLKSLLNSIQNKYPDSTMEVYMGGKADYRFALFPEYKAGRGPKPTHFQAMFDYLCKKGAIIPEGIEADDAVCIRAYECMELEEDFVLAGVDKDLRQIPCRHYDYGKDVEVILDDWTADFNFYTQLLMGDAADNIPGIRGIGIKTAHKLLADCPDEDAMYAVCCEHWEDHEAMQISAELLYLLRHDKDEWGAPLIEKETSISS